MSTRTHEDYPEDEFDIAGRDRAPQAVHRSPRTVWRTLLPVLTVVVLAPLLAWGAVNLLGDAGTGPTAAQETTSAAEDPAAPEETAPAEGAAPPAEAAPTEEAAPEEEAPPTPEPTTEAADVAYGTTIAVLNGSGRAGLAADVVSRLAAEGFTSGFADNYGGGAPATTTLYYNNAELAATAQEVGRILGIGTVVEAASATDAIAIVLRADFPG